MKTRKRILIFCTTVLFLAGLIAAASASAAGRSPEANRFVQEWESFCLLKNGETVRVYVEPSFPGFFYPASAADGWGFNDFLFDTDRPVTARSSADWIRIEDVRGGPHIIVETNRRPTDRTGTITFTAEGYSAKVRLTQWGSIRITSVVRNGDTVTVKFKPAKSAKNCRVDLFRNQIQEGGEIQIHTQVTVPAGTLGMYMIVYVR